MKQRAIFSCVISLLLVAVVHGRTALVLTNGLDDASDYSSFTAMPNATASNPSANTSDLGGTPNVVQVQSLITSAGAANFSIKSSATCNPETLGGISTIDWETEIRKKDGGNSDTGLTPALWQGGKLYVYVGTGVKGGDWEPHSFRETSFDYSSVGLTGAVATDFESYDLTAAPQGPPLTNSGDNPVFTSKGSEITFGYIAYAGTSSTGFDRRTAIKNGKITVYDFQYPLNITTAFGNGADAQTDEYNKSSTAGGNSAINVRWLNTTADRNDNIVLRFDISHLGKAVVTNAALELVKYRNHGGGPMCLYGVINGQPGDTLGDWSEATLSYANAPWIEQDETFDDNDLIGTNVVKLINAFPVAGDSGDVMSSQSEDLLTFIQSDTNGLVTLILTRENLVEAAQERFATKEATTLDDGGGSGPVGSFAPKLVLGVKFEVKGTLVLIL